MLAPSRGLERSISRPYIDTYSCILCQKVYTEKNGLIAADMLNDKVIPLFCATSTHPDRSGNRVLWKERNSAFELYLNLEDIEHSKIKAYSSQTNGICECFHKTMKNEYYDAMFRKKLYRTLTEIQEDVDHWIYYYNFESAHSGKYCYGKTLWQTW